ncbi:MAG TPA: sec-independent translocase [Propionibacteriaceae bacterium]|nr:sec-independent translocase [Propionibacteriaceae bacterium]
MFDVGGPEFLLLLVAAVILFGPEKLPEFFRKAARVVRYLRTAAGSAQEQLSKELGPGFEDIDLRDLSPKTFIQKHLLDDVEPIVADVKQDFAEASAAGSSATKTVNDALNGARSSGGEGAHNVMAPATPSRVLTPFDPDAT